MSGESKRSFVHGDRKQSCLHLTSVSTNFGRMEVKANVKAQLDPIRKQVRLLKHSHRYAKQKAGEGESHTENTAKYLLISITNCKLWNRFSLDLMEAKGTERTPC